MFALFLESAVVVLSYQFIQRIGLENELAEFPFPRMLIVTHTEQAERLSKNPGSLLIPRVHYLFFPVFAAPAVARSPLFQELAT